MPMEVRAAMPLGEFAADIAAIRDFVQAADDLGYSHIRMPDHVLGADPKYHSEVPRFPYTHQSYFHEPFTVMSYLAAITKRVHLGTAVLILPSDRRPWLPSRRQRWMSSVEADCAWA